MLTPGLYLVTPDQADGDALVAAVAALLPARPALVQYRNKLADAAARRAPATRLLAVISDVFSAPGPAARAAAYAGLFPGPSQETTA